MATIKKKVLSTYFDKIVSGEKTYELRLADWKCNPGDTLHLVDMDPKTNKPTGREIKRTVGVVVKTKNLDFFTQEEIDEHGYQIISLLNNEMPTIRIKNGWLLREKASKHLHELWGEGKEFADDEWLDKKVASYRGAWKPFEEKTLQGMTELLGLTFRQNIIDVHIAPWFHAFSDPMVIGVTLEPDIFVDTLTHELLHRLLTDNTSAAHDAGLAANWRKLFGDDHSFTTLVHIPVHAAHKALYLDVLNEPKRLKRDIANNEQSGASDYTKAWEYVEKEGYKEIINKLKKSYEAGAPIATI